MSAAERLQGLAPTVLAAQLGVAVAAASDPPPPGLTGQGFQLPLQLADHGPLSLRLWVSAALLAQRAEAFGHAVLPTDIGCELANVLAGQLLTQLAQVGTVGRMGLPAQIPHDAEGHAAAPCASEGWWRCPPHWLHLALVAEGR